MKQTQSINIIAAIGENRELGLDNKLLWHIPEDMKRFKRITEGNAVIMGRKTFESIGKSLPKRINIVLTHDIAFFAKDCFIAHSFEEAITIAKKFGKGIFIIGGEQIYKKAIDCADKLYLTLVKGTFKADSFFPDYSSFKKIIAKKSGKSRGFEYTFLELER